MITEPRNIPSIFVSEDSFENNKLLLEKHRTSSRPLDFLVIHCTATPEYINITGKQIKEWHTSPKPKGNGWKQVGYTYLFLLNGTIEQLVENNNDGWVDVNEVTNGASGFNSKALHICYVGGLCSITKKPKDTRTVEQIKSLTSFVKDFNNKFPKVKIVGHNELSNKACPSFNVQTWLHEIGVINTI